MSSSQTALPPLVAPADQLTRDEVARYSRHLIIPDLGVDGQKRLKNARVLVIGAGGLGAPTLLYLAAAGVGTLGIVDGISAPGKRVAFRAEMDILVLVSNCPQMNNPCNDFNPTPLRMIVTAGRE